MDQASAASWALLWDSQDIAERVICSLDAFSKRSLRLASKGSLAAVKRCVGSLTIDRSDQLASLPRLALHERFPNLRRLTLGRSPDRSPDVENDHPYSFAGLFSEDTGFVDFGRKDKPPPTYPVRSIAQLAQTTLSQLPKLTALVLTCTGVAATEAAELLAQHCPQLQELALPEGGFPGAHAGARRLACASNDCRNLPLPIAPAQIQPFAASLPPQAP